MAGIDYGMGTTNVDHETGIRYGVISQNELVQAWSDASEPDYGDPTCPKCGGEVEEYQDDEHDAYRDGRPNACADYACEGCKLVWESGDCYPDEAVGFNLDDEEYRATAGSDGDIFIMRSPYYTMAEYCSPCAPGAGYIVNEGDVKTYCFGHDMFWDTEEKRAPYRVWSVETGEEMMPEGETDRGGK
jgi:hypothetical protein